MNTTTVTFGPILWISQPHITQDATLPEGGVLTKPTLASLQAAWTESLFPMIFSGRTGTGKTHSAVAFLHAYAQAHPHDQYAATYWSMDDLEDYLDETWAQYKSKAPVLERATSPRVLVLDDLGCERDTDAMKDLIFRIIDRRVKKTTIFTTNLNVNDLRGRYGARIQSRLRRYTWVDFVGHDLRAPLF